VNWSSVASAPISWARSMNRRDCSLSSWRFRLIDRLAVGEPLADDTTDQSVCPLFIANAQRYSVAIAKIEFSQIAGQVRLAHMEITAIDAALQNRKEIFDSIGMSVAANILVHAVGHNLMAGELGADLLITPRFIGTKMTSLICIFCNNILQGFRGNVGDIEGPDAALTFHHATTADLP